MNTHRGEPCGSHRPSEPVERLTLVEAAKRVAYFGHHRRRCPCLLGGLCDCGMAELQRHVFEDVSDGGVGHCPVCYSRSSHGPNCWLIAALSATGEAE